MTIKVIEEKEKCPYCGRIIKHEKTIIICDNCNQEISSRDYALEFTIFPLQDDKEAVHLHFCSWKCLKKFIIKNKTKLATCDFMVLPYLHPYALDEFLKEFLGV